MRNYGDYSNETMSTAKGERFSADEGLELIRVFQSIPRRADRSAALDIIKRFAAQSCVPDQDTIIMKTPRAI
ncbi:hypothetical protein [Bradyrhizobium prioriisuperbiae]|uniref:hypothetical protein n=1 Tax=Bradyrhizobium prioriisuperbiae TaxID=2854389 RepID=UPI0028E6E73C|nr:hypothetical protein [Bradyrhizobium prioritasuperba]